MEQIFDGKGGVSQLIAGLIVVLSLNIIIKVGELFFKSYKEKDQLTESAVRSLTEALQKTTASVIRLDQRIHQVEEQLTDLPKFKVELRRIIEMIRSLAGPKWPEVKQAANEVD